MSEFAKEIISANIEDELQRSYLDYAMSVIVGRALPDVKDGLKPVHRRVLYAMKDMGNDWNKPYKKSARVVGDVIGKYHPHGDSAAYDTIVRMAQSFSLRYPLVDGQGNFGSVDGDSAAAMRYTEVRMARVAHELLADIDKETVDFVANYDESEREPAVFPTRVPNLLVNGSTGIAVGMATNMPPHNLGETVDACIAVMEHPDIGLEQLMERLPGPDFPTAGIINGVAGIRDAYATGRGKIYVRARAQYEPEHDRIVISELPYQVNKAMLLEKIGELVKEKRVEGITAIRDESDKDGMRAVIDLRRGENGDVVLNQLFQLTQLQTVFGINMVALIDGQPRLLTLREIIDAFIRHRREVVSRRTLFELRKARQRAHLLEGLAIALANIDEVIVLIRAAANREQARTALVGRTWPAGFVGDLLARAAEEGLAFADPSTPPPFDEEGRYRMSERQAQAILEMQLQRLTGLERDKIETEYRELLEEIRRLLEILGSDERLMAVIREELVELRERYADERRTEILTSHLDMRSEDLIPQQDMVVTFSYQGYVKAQPVEEYRSQRRGGRGRSATRLKDDDFVDHLFVASSHDTILCFSSAGKAYWLRVFELPVASHGGRGRPIVNLLPLAEGERITVVLPLRAFDAGQFVMFATAKGVVKKTELAAFSRPRSSGIIAIELQQGDQLVAADITSGDDDVMLLSNAGKALRFSEKAVRSMGRTARGIRGITLRDGQRVIAQVIVREQGVILTATEHGYGKRTRVAEHPGHGRGGQGVIAIQTSDRNGEVIGALQVDADDEVMLVTNTGTLIRTPVDSISELGRNTQGVRLIGLGDDERLIGLARVPAEAQAEAGDAAESQ